MLRRAGEIAFKVLENFYLEIDKQIIKFIAENLVAKNKFRKLDHQILKIMTLH